MVLVLRTYVYYLITSLADHRVLCHATVGSPVVYVRTYVHQARVTMGSMLRCRSAY